MRIFSASKRSRPSRGEPLAGRRVPCAEHRSEKNRQDDASDQTSAHPALQLALDAICEPASGRIGIEQMRVPPDRKGRANGDVHKAGGWFNGFPFANPSDRKSELDDVHFKASARRGGNAAFDPPNLQACGGDPADVPWIFMEPKDRLRRCGKDRGSLKPKDIHIQITLDLTRLYAIFAAASDAVKIICCQVAGRSILHH